MFAYTIDQLHITECVRVESIETTINQVYSIQAISDKIIQVADVNMLLIIRQ